ncbi:hypothetical protein HPB50_019372 [Hyalomma asiaticum]|uniref:Uncharacterized protein n=1 Tax=Hyalomma asiaticum TaxID=266040 RepID=A0ACB7SGZ1_HYAAI|nr:hypothetical protein HPB50_019372 [Hyalomma asiaticum]
MRYSVSHPLLPEFLAESHLGAHAELTEAPVDSGRPKSPSTSTTMTPPPTHQLAPPIEKDGDYETAAISWSDSRALHVENRRTAPLARRKILSLVDSVTCLCIAACRFANSEEYYAMTARRQAGSSELALETTLSPGGDVAVSRDCATADEVLDATECSDSASAPTSATDFQERQEVCGCAATVVNLEEQLSEHQANWKAI